MLRLGTLSRMACLEAERQQEGVHLAGRVRRVQRFRHHVQEACPGMEEGTLRALAQLSSFGGRPLPSICKQPAAATGPVVEDSSGGWLSW